MNKLFIEFYPQKLFSSSDAYKSLKNKQVCKNTLSRLANHKIIRRIRNGIYYIIPLDNPEFYPNPIHIASYIRKDAIICCRSALAVYGLTGLDTNIYAYSIHPAKIRIHDHTFRLIKDYGKIGFDKVEYNTSYGMVKLKVTDIERTIVDCLRTRTVSFQDMISILSSGKPALSIRKLTRYLDNYRKPLLYNKIGLLLDVCSKDLSISESDLKDIKSKLTKKIFYLKEKGLTLVKPRYKYYGKWNIMLPQQLFEHINKQPTI